MSCKNSLGCEYNFPYFNLAILIVSITIKAKWLQRFIDVMCRIWLFCQHCKDFLSDCGSVDGADGQKPSCSLNSFNIYNTYLTVFFYLRVLSDRKGKAHFVSEWKKLESISEHFWACWTIKEKKNNCLIYSVNFNIIYFFSSVPTLKAYRPCFSDPAVLCLVVCFYYSGNLNGNCCIH